MPKQPLDLVYVHTCLNESRGEGMPEIVKVKIFDPGFLQRHTEGAP